MDQVTVIAWGSIEFLLCPLLFFFFLFPFFFFFFFSFFFLFPFLFFSQVICRMKNCLTNKNTKEITFQSPVDPINYRVITGPKHLTMQHTSKTDFLIDLSRIRPPTRLGVASNQKWPTFTFLVHVHGPGFTLKRGRHLIHIALSSFLLDTLTV
jgi:hypothetical protein